MNQSDTTINISFGTIVKAVLFVLLIWFLFVLKDIVLIVLTAIVIASAMEPAVLWLVRHKVPRVFSVLSVYALLIAVFALLFYAFTPTLLRELSGLLAELPGYLGGIDVFSPVQEITSATPGTGSGLSLANLARELENALSITSGGFFQTVSTVFGGIVSFILIIVFSFYFSVRETGVDDFLRVVTPTKYQKKVLDLWKRSQVKIGLWMQGQLILAVIVGVLVYLVLTILDVRYALLLAILAAVFELIPVFGPILSAIPAVGIAFVDGGTTLALIVVGAFVIIQQFENHLLYPLVVTKVVGVPPLLIILALIVGATLAGFLGIILSVPAAAIVHELVRDIEKDRKAKLQPTGQL
jgi:predicted PurR-regulated permease PerM